jgi:hypothetical protein
MVKTIYFSLDGLGDLGGYFSMFLTASDIRKTVSEITESVERALGLKNRP